MITDIYYVLILLSAILRPRTLKGTDSRIERLREITANENVSQKDLLYLLRVLFTFVLISCGIVSSQYIIFTIILVTQFIPSKNRYITLICNYIFILGSLFAVLNRYHFKIDLPALIAGLMA